MINIQKLKQAADEVRGWGNCCDSWTDSSEDNAACVVGMLDKETGETYPVATVDCELYYSPDSSKLAHYYATANPLAILELIERLENSERQRDELLAALEKIADTSVIYADSGRVKIARDALASVKEKP